MFEAVDRMFPIVFIAVIAGIIFVVASGIKEWNNDNNSPRVTIPAKVRNKKQQTEHFNQPNAGDISGVNGFTVMMETTIMLLLNWKVTR